VLRVRRFLHRGVSVLTAHQRRCWPLAVRDGRAGSEKDAASQPLIRLQKHIIRAQTNVSGFANLMPNSGLWSAQRTALLPTSRLSASTQSGVANHPREWKCTKQLCRMRWSSHCPNPFGGGTSCVGDVRIAGLGPTVSHRRNNARSGLLLLPPFKDADLCQFQFLPAVGIPPLPKPDWTNFRRI
jgi:hypothetical protein